MVAGALVDGAGVNDFHPYLTVDGELWWSLGNRTEINGQPLRPAPTGVAPPGDVGQESRARPVS